MNLSLDLFLNILIYWASFAYPVWESYFQISVRFRAEEVFPEPIDQTPAIGVDFLEIFILYIHVLVQIQSDAMYILLRIFL